MFVTESILSQGVDLLPPISGRQQAGEGARSLVLPTGEEEEWRYSPVDELDLGLFTASVVEPSFDGSVDSPVGGTVAAVTLDGWPAVVSPAKPGVDVSVAQIPAVSSVDGWGNKFDQLHQAFNPSVLEIKITAGAVISDPIVVVHKQSQPGLACFPHVKVVAGANCEASVVEVHPASGGLGLIVPVVDLDVGDGARLSYVQMQDLDRDQWMIGRQVWTIGSQASARSGVAAFGARYARTRIDSHLVGPGADSTIAATYYTDDNQAHDFRVFQQHKAPNTRSDLLFKGAQDDKSTSIYTGMIHIHPGATGCNAFQTNRNLKLSPDAWAWSVPNLEIENDDVRCSHASTVAPIDEDQAFYLQSRGVAPSQAERLVLQGFLNEAVELMPVSAVHQPVADRVVAKLDRRDAK